LSFKEAETLKKRALAFLKNAEHLYEEKEYDLAAFNLEQYCQLILKYKLLTLTGTYPRTHSIVNLLRTLGKIGKQNNILNFVEKHIMYLTKIEDAYIGARYLPRAYEEKEVKELIKFIKEVFSKFVEEI